MRAAGTRARAAAAAPPAGLPRLLSGVHRAGPVLLDEHVGRLGPLPRTDLIAAVEASGLRGRGGAAFPTGAKLRAVAARRGRPIIVVNATEAEPVSGKDKVLLGHAPHLVLDGAVAVAEALGAREAIVAVCERAADELEAVRHGIEERRAGGDAGSRVALTLAAVPDGFVVGEETALVNVLNGGPPKPTFKPPLPSERGVRGAPTLVQNAETLAHLALIARFGPAWFRELGTREEPGSVLVTLSGAVRRPGVYELALGTPLPDLVDRAGGVTDEPAAFLIGGYFGTWVTATAASSLQLSAAGLRAAGASLGAGAVVVLPRSACGVTETARVARYLAEQNAGQCGPCVFGLQAIASAVERLARNDGLDTRPSLRRWLEQVSGRGACRHPDGVARLVASAFDVFADDLDHHLRGRACAGRARHVLPVSGYA